MVYLIEIVDMETSYIKYQEYFNEDGDDITKIGEKLINFAEQIVKRKNNNKMEIIITAYKEIFTSRD